MTSPEQPMRGAARFSPNQDDRIEWQLDQIRQSLTVIAVVLLLVAMFFAVAWFLGWFTVEVKIPDRY